MSYKIHVKYEASKKGINWYVFIFLVFNNTFRVCFLPLVLLELFYYLFILDDVHHFFKDFILCYFNRVLSSTFIFYQNVLMYWIYLDFKLKYHVFFLFTSQCSFLQFFIWPVFKGHHQSFLQLTLLDW